MTVDQINSPEARLQAVWLLKGLTQDEAFFLVGLPPATLVWLPGRSPMRLTDAHRFDLEAAGMSTLLLQGIGTLLPDFSPQATLSIDRSGIAALIDHRNGLELAGRRLSGVEAIGWLDSLSSDPILHLQAQSELINAWLATYDEITFDGHFAPAVVALGEHYTAHGPYLDIAQSMLPTYSGNFHISPVRENFTLTSLADGSPAVILSP